MYGNVSGANKGFLPESMVEEDTTNSNDEELEQSDVKSAGAQIGVALSSVRDAKIHRYDVVVNGKEVAYAEMINDQDNVSGKSNKFFELVPNPTELLYGFIHAHALLNTRTKRGWIAHCRLKSTTAGRIGDGYILWEIWETRCVKPRIDGIVMNLDGSCLRIQNIVKWLVDNDLSCDLDGKFDEEFHAE
jgi:hypothetical protein